MADQKSDNAEIIAARKAGMQISDIAAKFGKDKMDIRDICKDIDRTGRKAKKA